MANEVAKKESFSTALTTELNNIQSALPEGFNIQRFVQNGVALLNGNETLAKFAKENGTAQIKQGMIGAAYLGLDFMSSEAYLIPYGKKLDFSISYKGNTKLAKMYSVRPIKDIYAKVVREGDDFAEAVVNGEPTINFNPKPFNNGAIIGAFAVCLFTDGGMMYDSMSLDEIENTRSHAKAKNSMAWSDFFSEMAKKTVLRRLCKNIELDLSATQRNIYDEDMAIETDAQEIAKADIEENANTVPFEEPEVVAEQVEDEPLPFEG